jgi:hypothetical protein
MCGHQCELGDLARLMISSLLVVRGCRVQVLSSVRIGWGRSP